LIVLLYIHTVYKAWDITSCIA